MYEIEVLVLLQIFRLPEHKQVANEVLQSDEFVAWAIKNSDRIMDDANAGRLTK